AVASGRTLFDAIRDRLGFRLALLALAASVAVNLFTLVVEIAGMSLAIQEATKIGYFAWLAQAALLVLVLLWKAPFQVLEDGSAFLGLAMLVAVVAMIKLGPSWPEVGAQLLHPGMDTVDTLPGYLFAAISLFGGYMTPSQFFFYSSGAIEEEWDGRDLFINRVTSFVGS